MSVAATVSFSNEFCPNCGTEAPLNGVSGFCIPCTKERYPRKAVCESCGRVEERGQFRKICQYCQKEEWLKKNADRLEVLMSIGLTLSMAVGLVSKQNLPICLSCGYKIRGGTKDRHFFCRKTRRCKSAAIKFKHLKERKNLSKEEALSETLKWIDKERNGTEQ
jgi:predicted RNA-binding Zn-ribbon protein involved in translation (DUF1610 family)